MTDLILVEQAGSILKIGINRPDKRNAMNQEMFRGLAAAYTRLCDDPQLRCGILYSTADLFTAGLDLMDMASVLTGQDDAPQLVDEDQVDPFDWASVAGKQGRKRTKPIISAIHGKCYAAGIEVALGTDFIIAAENAEFAQAEIRRGLIPLGGAIDRLVKYTGRANAMRWLLTGDIFDVHEAHRMGLVQEVVADGQVLERALEIAERVASAAPLGVQATLANANVGASEGELAASDNIMAQVRPTISESKDLQEGITALFEKREPVYTGT